MTGLGTVMHPLLKRPQPDRVNLQKSYHLSPLKLFPPIAEGHGETHGHRGVFFAANRGMSFFAMPSQSKALHGPEKRDELPLGHELKAEWLGAEGLEAEGQPTYKGSMRSGFIRFFGTNVKA